MPILATNKRARFDYEILETFEAGLKLFGHEVKAARSGLMSLKASYVTIGPQGPELLNAHIGKYKQAGELKGYEPTRSRQLLLKAREIKQLRGKIHEQGLTLVPLSVYTQRNLLKLEFALGKGKTQFDKRRSIKEREWKRQKARILN
ncbi:SsrA-binding protein SmpB [Candidatus Uhrbacteria bacterium]|nr:SsrA-binding protein SmpB [Candidatus Uhrbacteria bacterium]